MIADQKTVASKFKNYFANVAKNLLKDIGESNNKFQDFLKNPNEHSFSINETDPIEVYDLLDKINVNKAADIYGIPPKLVEMTARKLKNNLILIFNYPIEQGIFPEKLKIGLIFAIHKGDSKLAFSNFQPIFILPLFNKIFEKLMYARLIDFTNKRN